MRLKRSCLCGDRSLPRRRPPSFSSTAFGARSVAGTGNFFSLFIRDEIARRLQLPSKLMAQHKFGARRRIVLSFERQPFPAPCHVDQDVAHPRAWRALGHLTTFDRVLSALRRRNHLPLPPASVQCCHRHQGVVSIVSRPGCTSGPIVAFAPQHTLRALRARTRKENQCVMTTSNQLLFRENTTPRTTRRRGAHRLCGSVSAFDRFCFRRDILDALPGQRDVRHLLWRRYPSAR